MLIEINFKIQIFLNKNIKTNNNILISIIKPGLILKPWLHLETSVLMRTLKSFSE
jgi:hypothetical protein